MVVGSNPNPRLMIALVAFALGVLVSLLLRGCGCNATDAVAIGGKITERIVTRTEIQRDTVVQVQRYPVTRIVRQVMPVTVRDTAPTLVAPFVAQLDTIVGDTIQVRYQWPEHRISLELRHRPDSIRTITVERLQREEVIHKPRWTVGLSAGYGVSAQQSSAQGWSLTNAPFVGLTLTYNLLSL